TSRDGLRSRKPTGSSALTAGIGKRSSLVASWRAKPEARFLRFTQLGSGFRFRPTAQASFAKVMERGKDVARQPEKDTIRHSRQPKPMPPNAHWPRSANHLDLRSTDPATPPRKPR